MVGEACLPSNAYYPQTPDYTLCSGVHVCWSEHSDSSFVYGLMILDYGFGTMTATTFSTKTCIVCIFKFLSETFLMSTHNTSFCEERRKYLSGLLLNYIYGPNSAPAPAV